MTNARYFIDNAGGQHIVQNGQILSLCWSTQGSQSFEELCEMMCNMVRDIESGDWSIDQYDGSSDEESLTEYTSEFADQFEWSPKNVNGAKEVTPEEFLTQGNFGRRTEVLDNE